MRKIKEVLRLALENNCTARQIAKSCNIGRSTVSDYLARAREAGLTWPIPSDLDDTAIENLILPSKPSETSSSSNQQTPPMEYLYRELKKNGVTLQFSGTNTNRKILKDTNTASFANFTVDG